MKEVRANLSQGRLQPAPIVRRLANSAVAALLACGRWQAAVTDRIRHGTNRGASCRVVTPANDPVTFGLDEDVLLVGPLLLLVVAAAESYAVWRRWS